MSVGARMSTVFILILLVSPTFLSLASTEAASSKVDPTLLRTGSSLPQRVIVYGTGNMDPISRLMRLTYSFGGAGSYYAFGTATKLQVSELASSPGVLRVIPDVALNYNDSRVDSSGGGLIQTDMFRIRDILGADKVNSVLNVTGKGVNVAIVDTGTDFGNPELSGAVARDSKGVPIALDPDGMGIVLTNTTLSRFVNSSGVYVNLYNSGRGTKVAVYLGAAGYPAVVQSIIWSLRDFKIGANESSFINSLTGAYHFGLAFEVTPYGSALFPALVVDSKIAGVYDTVYMDMLTAQTVSATYINPGFYFNATADWSFLNDPPHHIGDGTEGLAASFSGKNHPPDISAGLLGARVLDAFGVIASIKSKFDFDLGAVDGALLAPMDPYGNYFGVMFDIEGHGTQTASNVASQGLHSYNIYGNGTRYKLEGVAPGSRIIAVKALFIGDILYGWMWASGFDYSSASKQWVYSGNHKAQIISNSWGTSNWPIFVSGMGYDVISILEDALSAPGSFSANYPGTLFVQAMGNGGPGYGTITSPAASTFALSVGASTSWHSALQFSLTGAPYYGGNSAYLDEVISWSDRGPSPIGDPKPDVVNVGAFGFTPAAILTAKGNGSDAWAFFGGTSQATPLTAGVAALVEEALVSKSRGVNPLVVKSILMSTAHDTGNDPFVQGAGRVDALSAVSYALGGSKLVSGVYSVTTNSTYSNVLGSLTGAQKSLSRVINQTVSIPSTPQPDGAWFAGSVQAGSSSAAIFTIRNPTSSPIPLNITTTTFEQVGEVSISNVSRPGDSLYLNLTRVAGAIPKNADMMIVREVMPFDSWWNSTVSPYYADSVTRLRLQVYNWNDLSNDGLPELGELSLVNTNYAWGNAEEARVSQPSVKFTNTPLIGVYQNANYDSYWFGPSTTKASPVHFTIYIYYLKKVSWDWVSVDRNHLSAPMTGTTSFSAKLSVPPTASPGIYEGFITLNGADGRATQVPVSVDVPIAASQKGVPYVFGGQSDSNGLLYDNGATYGATDFSWRYESGNWRSYKVNVTDPTVNQGLATVSWSSPQTSLNLFVLDPQGSIIASSVPAGLYKTLGRASFFIFPLLIPSASNDYLGVSPFNPLGWGGGFAPSQNAGNTSSSVQFPVSETGLYTVIVHTTVYSGKTPDERFSGIVELTTLLPIQKGPTISVTPPVGLVRGTISIPVAISGTDIVSASYSVDSSPAVKILGDGTSIDIDTSRLPDGDHSVTISASDLVGHVSTEAFTFSTLNSGPVVFIGNPPLGGVVNGIVNITYSVQGSRITSATLSIDGNPVHPTSGSTYLWNSSASSDGAHTIRLSALNAAGANSSASVAFTTDNQALAQERTDQRYQLNLLNSELTFSLVALAVALVAAAALAVRRRS